MATHSSVLTWRIPGTGEPGGLPSLGSQSRTQLKRLSSSKSLKASQSQPHPTALDSLRVRSGVNIVRSVCLDFLLMLL